MADIVEQGVEEPKEQNRFGMEYLRLEFPHADSRNEADVSDAYPYVDKNCTSTMMPQTPRRVAPNSSRKRLYPPLLFRDTASPSRSTRMSNLFEDAASTLQHVTTPSRHSSSNTKRLRIAANDIRFTKFGHGHSNDNPAPAPMSSRGYDMEVKFPNPKQIKQGCETLGSPSSQRQPIEASKYDLEANGLSVYESLVDDPQLPGSSNAAGYALAFSRTGDLYKNPHIQEPISSCFATPLRYSTPYKQKSSTILATPRRCLQSLSPTDESCSDDEEHSTHGVRLIMPYSHCEAVEAQQASIEAWLEQVLRVTSENDPIIRVPTSPGECASKACSAASDLEKAHQNDLPHRRSSDKENVPPSLPPQMDPWVKKFTHPQTPSGFLSTPAKRKKPYVIEQVSIRSESKRSTPKDFTVNDDELAAALTKLSPSVEQHRKCHRPKRERCASYWDTDIFEPSVTKETPLVGATGGTGN